MPTYRTLQQYAIAISIASIIYNGAEGAVSIGLGADAASRSLIFFGIQSGIEVLSATLVVWRFRRIAKPGEERSAVLSPEHLKFEKYGTLGIGILLIILALATEGTSIAALVLRDTPNTSIFSLIVSSTALVIMILIWLPKRYLAKALDSSVMKGEATCSLSCIQLTIVLFIGSLIFKVWKGGWWVDSATAIVLGFFFGWEGVKMVRWAGSSEFTGGCCSDCGVPPTKGKAELGEVYRDICGCCSEKEECRSADECKCSGQQAKTTDCCTPVQESGAKCCTRKVVPNPVTPPKSTSPTGANDVPLVDASAHAEQPQEPVPRPEPTRTRCCANC